MLKKRIIPCLDVKNARVVKGVNFIDLKDAGDPVSLARAYMEEGADELTFLDISASNERRATMLDWVKIVADAICIPFTVGGGISSADEALKLVALGADKVSLNTAAVRRPELIGECAEKLGSQAVVVAVDTKRSNGKWEVFVEGGRTPTGRDGIEWCVEAAERGAGELLLTSMDQDGTKKGYDVEFYEKISRVVSIPIIASGGAGKMEHILEAFRYGADAALLASLLHFGEIRIGDLKKYLDDNGIPVRI
ncbi:imidazole glycerol phosphate synthase subunit HisF [Synergistaceae bacterium OttesenSCG-928-I11]|nr:imidazole glycerol phosphate synthase subunit HisF [Synergistaceae bacterium OttesenSCG-928-I11]